MQASQHVEPLAAAGFSEKRTQLFGQGIGRCLGHVMPTIDGVTAQVDSPRSPDREHIAVKVGEIVPRCPEAENGAFDALTGTACRRIMLAIDAKAGPVILDHRVHRLGVTNSPNVVLVVLAPHGLRRPTIPGAGIGQDRTLGLLGLRKEEPVPPRLREARVAALERRQDRHRVEHGQM